MKFLPYFQAEVAGGACIELLAYVLPEEMTDLLQLAIIQGDNKGEFLFPVEMELEVDEGFPGYNLAGIIPVFAAIPKTIVEGSMFAKTPFGQAEPYYTLQHDYVLLGVHAYNSQTSNPLDLNQFFANKFLLIYGISDFSGYAYPQKSPDGYTTTELPGGYIAAIATPEQGFYQTVTREVAFRINSQYTLWHVINILEISPFPDPPPSHFFLMGARLILTGDAPYLETLNGIPYDSFSCNGIYPSDVQIEPYGCFYQFSVDYIGLEYSSLLYGQQNGFSEGILSPTGSWFPFIFRPLPPIPCGLTQQCLPFSTAFWLLRKKVLGLV